MLGGGEMVPVSFGGPRVFGDVPEGRHRVSTSGRVRPTLRWCTCLGLLAFIGAAWQRRCRRNKSEAHIAELGADRIREISERSL